MLFGKLRRVKRLFRKKPPVAIQPVPERASGARADELNANVDMTSLVGIRRIRDQLEPSNAKHFDSADHFMNMELVASPEPIAQQVINEEEAAVPLEISLENALETAAGVSSKAPLETVYSEMVDEMKPKKSV